ncbi:hypothetical protein HUG17_10203 [Dermatophagoides farinae]|uniref:Uncharacterized protein n=1 Tax=Dermatophagoides farinae TaxID=6954 RepID=A0A9D4SC50_DERFA|nr:hypothetical protein HUG17_10203 [Dermatophagoides farinae]
MKENIWRRILQKLIRSSNIRRRFNNLFPNGIQGIGKIGESDHLIEYLIKKVRNQNSIKNRETRKINLRRETTSDDDIDELETIMTTQPLNKSTNNVVISPIGSDD